MDQASRRAARQIFTVSQLTRKIKSLLEQNFSMIWISGEISNLRIPSSGHAYFTLKDDKAQIATVMFRGQLRQLRFDLEDGLELIGLGRITVYEPRGNYQIILEYMEPKGAGALQLAFEQTKKKLAQEGLFDADAKKTLPFLPQTVCIITSPTGAAIRDILNILNRRFPNLCIKVVPVRVQGAGAVDDIVAALDFVNRKVNPDIIILSRGGGSIEDLAAFNSEPVARSIYASEIPVLSAVGHEIDFTIADFVADLRAPTPSAAAEIVVPVKIDLLSRCLELRQRCHNSMSKRLSDYKERLNRLEQSVVHPLRHIENHQQRIDDLTGRLERANRGILRDRQAQWSDLHLRLKYCAPAMQIQKARSKVDILYFNLKKYNENLNSIFRERLVASNTKLKMLSPASVLQRGYSITRKLPDLGVVMDADEVEKGELLEIMLAKGKLTVTSEG